jgi:transposase
MRSILRLALGLAKTVLLGARVEGDRVVVSVRPHESRRRRCPVCGRRCDVYDSRPQPRRWRASDLARSMCFLEYRPARVRCPEHGVRVEDVPWARPGSRFTRDFEDRVAWLAVRCTASAVAEECRVEWHTVGGICRRVWRDLEAARGAGRFDGVRRIGVDETSYKKGHKYLTVVVDHDRGCLIWAHEGVGKEVLNLFLDELTREQRRAVEVVTADGARWIKSLVKRRCPNARWVMDPFHVVSWMNDALDAVRRDEWQVAKRAARDAAPARRDGPGRPRKGEGATPEARALREAADAIKGSRYALVKNPEDLTESQAAKLDEVRRAGSRLFRAWELKEDLRAVFAAGDPGRAEALLDDWPRRAAYCKIPQVVAVEKKVRRRRDDVVAAVDLGLSNARVEAVNNKIKVTVRMGYGFRNVDNLVGLLMLRCSDVRPSLPGREAAVAA